MFLLKVDSILGKQRSYHTAWNAWAIRAKHYKDKNSLFLRVWCQLVSWSEAWLEAWSKRIVVVALGQSFSKRKGNKEIVLDFMVKPTVQYISLSTALFFVNSHPKTKKESEYLLKAPPQHITGKYLGYVFISQEDRWQEASETKRKEREMALGDLGKYRKCITLCYTASEPEDKKFPGVFW